jgi:type I restriction-modification system DNA methylase subunit
MTNHKQPDFIQEIESKIIAESTYSKEKSDKLGEVFTPPELINEMLDQIPVEIWSDSSKTFFDPCAGKGNFPIQIVKRLMIGLENEIVNPHERYKHIMENQMYMSEFQPESAQFIKNTFNPNGDIDLKLHIGDTLSMPKNYFEAGKTEPVNFRDKFFAF